MNAPLPLPPATWKGSATILLAHTAVLAILGTLETGKHAQVREQRGILRIENTEYQLKFRLMLRIDLSVCFFLTIMIMIMVMIMIMINTIFERPFLTRQN